MWPMVWYIPKISSTLHIFCTYVSVCAHMPSFGKWCTYKLWYWLLIVSVRVPIVPCAPVWPMLWYKPMTFETGSSFWGHVAVFDHEVDDLIHTHNLKNWFAIWGHVCELVPPCIQRFDTTYKFQYTLFFLNLSLRMCPFAPCGQWLETQLLPPMLVFHCELVLPYITVWPYVANGMIHTHNLWDLLSL